ncbi:POLG2 [Mytilus edulis]|uniref:POLG2 n=1 Tax=Mytilus edulis TaxID=6550 RepID=A0A8S3PYD5_MYTED|nr:POLG2 [Mytilus edulis]
MDSVIRPQKGNISQKFPKDPIKFLFTKLLYWNHVQCPDVKKTTFSVKVLTMAKASLTQMEKIISLLHKSSFVKRNRNRGKFSSYTFGPAGVLTSRNLNQLLWDSLVTSQIDTYPVENSVFRNTDEPKQLRSNLSQEINIEILSSTGINSEILSTTIINSEILSSTEINSEIFSSVQTSIVLQYFCSPSSALQSFDQWIQQRLLWWRKETTTVKLQCANGNKSYTPHLIECSTVLEHCLMACLCDAYTESTAQTGKKSLPTEKLNLHPKIAPYKLSIVIEDQFIRNDMMGLPYTAILSEGTLDSGTIELRNKDTTLKSTKQEIVVSNKDTQVLEVGSVYFNPPKQEIVVSNKDTQVLEVGSVYFNQQKQEIVVSNKDTQVLEASSVYFNPPKQEIVVSNKDTQVLEVGSVYFNQQKQEIVVSNKDTQVLEVGSVYFNQPKQEIVVSNKDTQVLEVGSVYFNQPKQEIVVSNKDTQVLEAGSVYFNPPKQEIVVSNKDTQVLEADSVYFNQPKQEIVVSNKDTQVLEVGSVYFNQPKQEIVVSNKDTQVLEAGSVYFNAPKQMSKNAHGYWK